MDRSSWIITIIVILLVIIWSLWGYSYYRLTRPLQYPASSLVKISEPIKKEISSLAQTQQGVKVLLVDMNADEHLSMPGVFNGEDAILMLHQSSNPFDHSQDAYFASDVVLNIFDKNKDGRIDPIDPIYKQLELKYYDKGKDSSPQYVPISQAGIHAIYIDPKYYSKDIFPPNDPEPHSVGTAIMTDSTARLIQQMLIDESYLKTPANVPVSVPEKPASAPFR